MDSEMVDAAAMGVEEEEISHIAAVQQIIICGAFTIRTWRQIDHLLERVSPLTERRVDLWHI